MNQVHQGTADRRVLHCDMDCFYAAVHMRDDPELRGRPVVIGGQPGGRGVIAAASYEARAFGVSSAMASTRAARLCPEAVFIRPDFSRYRAESQEVFAIFRRFTSIVQPVSIDEAYLDVSEAWSSWGSATLLAKEIRRAVLEERRLTVSVGVGPNRLIAKIASDHDKPDGLTVVSPRRAEAFLHPLEIRVLPGVGPATEKRMLAAGLRTVADVAALESAHLIELFGSFGKRLYRYARGEDHRPVRIERERKSLSSESTYSEDLSGFEAIYEQLSVLSQQVARGLEKRDLSACTWTVKVRYSDFTTLSRSRTLAHPVRRAERILPLACELVRKTDAGKRPVRLLGLGASNLIAGRSEQLDLFDP